MIFLWIALFVLAIVVFIDYIRRLRDPPGPRGLPIVGLFPLIMLGSLLSRKENHFFRTMSRRYGEIWSFRTNGQRFIVLASRQIISKAFKMETFSGRPLSGLHRYISKHRGVLTSDGPIWKCYRNLVIKAMHELAMENKNFEGIITKHLGKLMTFINGNQRNGSINTKQLFHSLSLTIILEIVFRLDCEFESHLVQRLMKNIDLITNSNITLSNCVFFMTNLPVLKYLIPGTMKLRNAIDENEAIVTGLYNEMVCTRKGSGDRRECIADYFINNSSSESDGNCCDLINHFNSIENCLDLIGAGSDTVAATLSWCCLVLARYQDVQRAMREEVCTRMKLKGINWISYGDHEFLPYVCSFIEEIFRWRTIIPRTVHRPMENVTQFGWTFTANDIVLGDTDTINHSADIWKEPDCFVYDRFVDKESKTLKGRPSDLIPFGIGKRNCLGENMAKTEIFISICNILGKYEIMGTNETISDWDRIFEGGNGLVQSPLEHTLKFKNL